MKEVMKPTNSRVGQNGKAAGATSRVRTSRFVNRHKDGDVVRHPDGTVTVFCALPTQLIRLIKRAAKLEGITLDKWMGDAMGVYLQNVSAPFERIPL
jgi:hypothetical protein